MIYFECKADEELITVLGITRRERMHAGNKPWVCKLLGKDQGSIGMVDEDPNSIQPPYIDEMTEVNYQKDIRLLYDSQHDNFIIQLCPRLENWIIRS
ncbi:MAG: hypothetical protein ACTSR3_04915 [Candidatus Helarchaeota archaeon]